MESAIAKHCCTLKKKINNNNPGPFLVNCFFEITLDKTDMKSKFAA